MTERIDVDLSENKVGMDINISVFRGPQSSSDPVRFIFGTETVPLTRADMNGILKQLEQAGSSGKIHVHMGNLSVRMTSEQAHTAKRSLQAMLSIIP